jgi:arylsulfatase A-like enzyme
MNRAARNMQRLKTQLASRAFPVAALLCLCLIPGVPLAVDRDVAAGQPDSRNRSGNDYPEQPTIVLICADDLDWDVLASDWPVGGERDGDQPVRFPNLKSMADEGLVFTNFNITTPVCAPSRASLLSGQYAHRHGVRVNQPGAEISNGFRGGFAPYGRSRDVALPLQKLGYETCFVGKYVHDGFEPDEKKNETWRQVIPRGWDRFHVCLGALYDDFWVVDSADGIPLQVKGNYRTDYEVARVIEYLEAGDRASKPRFVCWLAIAPHDPSTGFNSNAARHRGLYDREEPPSLLRKTGRSGLNLPQELEFLPAELDEDHKAYIRQKWRERLAATKALDEGVGRIRNHLARQGRLDNTLFVFTSDHGFRLGEHGHIGKRLPYDRITRVPLIVSGKGTRKGQCNELVANIDIAPTLLDLAGHATGSLNPELAEMDGLSFAGLLGDRGESAGMNRDGVLLENWEMEGAFTGRMPATWTAWRTRDSVYTEWATGGREYYDLASDPEQLDNRWSRLSAEEQESLSAALRNSRPSDSPPLLAIVHQQWSPLSELSQNIRFRSIVFSGFAECSRGVASVQLEITDEKTGRFWNGNQWSLELHRVEARLASPGSLISAWSYELQVPESALINPEIAPESQLRVSATASDRNGKTASWTHSALIKVTTRDPETWIDPPANDIRSCQPMMISGQACGVNKVDKVRLVIHNKDTDQFWDGGVWVDERASVDAEIEPQENGKRVNWHYKFEGSSPHRVFFGARALEKQYYDITVAWFELGPAPSNPAAAGNPK